MNIQMNLSKTSFDQLPFASRERMASLAYRAQEFCLELFKGLKQEDYQELLETELNDQFAKFVNFYAKGERADKDDLTVFCVCLRKIFKAHEINDFAKFQGYRVKWDGSAIEDLEALPWQAPAEKGSEKKDEAKKP